MTNTAVSLEIEPTKVQLQHYHADGYLILRHLFTAGEIAEWESEAARLMERKDLIDNDNIRCRWQNHIETGECRFDCFDPVIDLSPVFASLARDERLLRAISAIYGEPACLFKDKLI
jgi:2-aminoethylphosphonate dioxygenase